MEVLGEEQLLTGAGQSHLATQDVCLSMTQHPGWGRKVSPSFLLARTSTHYRCTDPKGPLVCRLTWYWMRTGWEAQPAKSLSRCPVMLPGPAPAISCQDAAGTVFQTLTFPQSALRLHKGVWAAESRLGQRVLMGGGCWAVWKTHPRGEAKAVRGRNIYKLNLQVPDSRSVPPDFTYKTQMLQ